MSRNKKTVFVGMSGGVDSSVAAYLLKQATPNNFSKLFGRPTSKGFMGYNTVGVFMRSYNIDGCAERDAEDARRTAEKLGIPFYVWDFEEEYKKKVVEYMVDGYRKGLTPNPDVMCNREIKFGIFLDKAIQMGADFVATGHYVLKVQMADRKLPNHPRFALCAARDPNKDQSYFLWTLNRSQLSRSLFPIGNLTKPEVRAIARRAGLPTAGKKDSQGICFLGQVAITDFLKDYIPLKKGAILSADGKKLGEHMGVQFYTIGQRHGLDLKHKQKALGIKGSQTAAAHYVAAKDILKNVLVVAEGMNNPALMKSELSLYGVNFINADISKKRLKVMARVRYRQPLSPAMLENKNKGWKLIFETPQKFVAPGQSAVFYSKTGELLGGGIIA